MALSKKASSSIDITAPVVAVHDQALAGEDPRLFMANAPDSAQAACFRVLRQRVAARKELRTVAVTSAEAGEGKTTCAVNLAMALGEGGRARVLLVEANLRAPSVAELFGLTPPLCFASQLASARKDPFWGWVVASIPSPPFHLLAVDPASPEPRLDARAFELAMKALCELPYDFIVIDAPSVLGSADVNLIQESVDGVLLTAWCHRSRAAAQLRAVEQLGPAKIVGFVLLNAEG